MKPRHLLNTTTLTFDPPLNLSPEAQSWTVDSTREYAILSHRWMANNDDEVLFDDIMAGHARKKPGFSKIEGTARQARKDGYDWIWIDTCCIDKRSSAELTESINSMYVWYKDACCCYAYLHDIEPGLHTICKSDWFDRGWTLQELIAPIDVKFFNRKWEFLGTRDKLAGVLWQRTGIHFEVLQGKSGTQDYSVAQKMSWAATRKTTRPEDMAYCLLGIFDVNMVPMYGEGEKAFIRLQEEIIRRSDDQSIFAWSMKSLTSTLSSLLAESPDYFKGCSSTSQDFGLLKGRPPFSTTNRGLSINLEITPWTVDTYLAFIDCVGDEPHQTVTPTSRRIGLFLRRLHHDDQYARINLYGDHGLFLDERHIYSDCFDDYKPRKLKRRQLFVPSSPRAHLGSDLAALGRGGCRILMRDYDQSSDDIFFPLDAPCQLTIVECAESSRFRQIAVGFNFDLDPVCLLTDNDATRSLTAPVRADDDDKVIEGRAHHMIEGQRYNEVVEEMRVYRRVHDPDLQELHDGIWRLRCHRRTTLDVQLQKELGDNGPQVCIRRSKHDHLIWEVELKYAGSGLRQCPVETE